MRSWKARVRDDLFAHPYRWLRPDFIPPSPLLSCDPAFSVNCFGVLSSPADVDAQFRTAWLLSFAEENLEIRLVRPFSDRPLLLEVELPGLNGAILNGLVRDKKATAGLDGWEVEGM